MTYPIAFPVVPEPRASILVVTYGNWGWVERAFRTLLANTPPVYELIVVDNDSPDGTGARLEELVEGATIVRSPRNVGFGVGNDLAARYARSAKLVLLNSDCLVEPNWLEPMLERADADASVGAVAGKLLDLDGRLQEAGSLLDRDARTVAYRRGAAPDDPAGSFTRDVLFASAGFLLVKRSVFALVGGFDAAFSPAYFEDVDLALAIEAHGLRIVYEPRAVARHVREVSTPSGTSGTLMKAHRPIVQRRWNERLATLPALEDVDRFPHREIATRDALTADRVLVIGAPREWLADLATRAAARPSTRWTVVSGEVDNTAGVDGLEFATRGMATELEARRFQASIVLVGPEASSESLALVARTQPQATVFHGLAELDRVAELRVALMRRALSRAG